MRRWLPPTARPSASFNTALGLLLGLALLLATLQAVWEARLQPLTVLQCLDVASRRVEACAPRHFQHGDLLFLRGTSLRTRVVLGADPASPYSHVGLVERRGGVPWLLHASPDPLPRRSEPQESELQESAGTSVNHAKQKIFSSGVHLEPLSVVLQQAAHAAVYRPNLDPSTTATAVEAARAYLGRPFDADLDLGNDAAIYCTELIWLAWRQAGVELLPDGPAAVSTPFGDNTFALPSQFLDSPHFELVSRLQP